MRYSFLSVIGQALRGNTGWTPVWRDAAVNFARSVPCRVQVTPDRADLEERCPLPPIPGIGMRLTARITHDFEVREAGN